MSQPGRFALLSTLAAVLVLAASDSAPARKTFGITFEAVDPPSTTGEIHQDTVPQAASSNTATGAFSNVVAVTTPVESTSVPASMPSATSVAVESVVKSPAGGKSSLSGQNIASTSKVPPSTSSAVPSAAISQPPLSTSITTTTAPNGLVGAAMPLLFGMQKAVNQAEKMVAPVAAQIQNKTGEAGKMLAPAAEQMKQKAGEAGTQIQQKANEFMRLAKEAQKKSPTVAPSDAGQNGTTRSKPTNSSEFQQRFTAHKERISMTNYDNTLVLGCAGVFVFLAALVAFVARHVALRSRMDYSCSEDTECESGLE